MSLADAMLEELREVEADAANDINSYDPIAEARLDDINEVSFNTNDSANGSAEKVEINSSQTHQISSNYNINQITSLKDSKKLADVMQSIEKFKASGKRDRILGNIDSDPEYLLIITANNLVAEIDRETEVIYTFVKVNYRSRFPELESVLQSPVEYVQTVRTLMNNVMNTGPLATTLNSALHMIICMSASTTQGTPLDDATLQRISEACDMALHLQHNRAHILEFVASRMSLCAPNLSVIIGPSFAAKLLGHVGGLSNLSKKSADSLYSLGAARRSAFVGGAAFVGSLSGVGGAAGTAGGADSNSRTANLAQQSYIYQSAIVQKLPADLHARACKLVANKCSLAARIDLKRSFPDGQYGDTLCAEIEKTYDKWQEPPPVKQIKPLPAPIEVPSKHRGGRRHRKRKERLGMTEMRKSANRMTFGEIGEDAYQADLGMSLNQLGGRSGGGAVGSAMSGGGRIRALQPDDKSKTKMSKSLQQRLQRQYQIQQPSAQAMWGATTSLKRNAAAAGASGAAGCASVMSYTPAKGLDITTPLAAEKPVDADQKYFSGASKFAKIG